MSLQSNRYKEKFNAGKTSLDFKKHKLYKKLINKLFDIKYNKFYFYSIQDLNN